MSRFTVDLNDSLPPAAAAEVPLAEPVKKPGRWRKILGISALVIFLIAIGAVIGGYFYWQGVKKTPQYSLALLVEASRQNDKPTIDSVIDINAVVDDFLPQITNKAVELYGRGLAPDAIARVARVAAPVLPAVKERAREELPGVIREKTNAFANIPFWAIAIGADRYLDIKVEGDFAFVKSKVEDRPLEVKMKRNGERWQIVGLKDEALATRIAQKVGQNIIAIATKGGINAAGEKLGIRNLQKMIDDAQDLLNEE